MLALKYPKETLKIIKEVKDDKTSGAIGLAIKSLDAFKPLKEIEGLDVKMLGGVARRLIKARPTMVCIGNVAAELFCKVMDRAVEVGMEKVVEIEAERLQKKLVMAKSSIANGFSQYVDKSVVILTLSDSRTVLEALKKTKEKLAQVFICVSEPGHDGERLSKELSDLGMRNLMIPDLAIGSIMPKVDIVALGADAIMSDGAVVNKIGSNTASKVAFVEGKKVFFLAESVKVNPKGEELNLEYYAGEHGDGYQPMFDVTPYGYAQRVLCENGELDLKDISALSDKYAMYRTRVKALK